jgi:hypothetical protein
LLVGAIMCGIAVLPAAAILAVFGYHTLIPSYSSVAYFEEYGFNLRLDLYRTADEMRDSGRYLSVINSMAYHTFMLVGWDWPHKARTSIYRIDDDHIAVLSALGNDYTVTLKPFAVAASGNDSGDAWQYLGAFDFAFPNERAKLEFFDPSLTECIPMGTIDPATWAEKPRPQARRPTCPTPSPQ